MILNSSGVVEVFEVGQDYYGQDYYIIIVQDKLLLQYHYYCIGFQFTAAAAAVHVCPGSDFMDLLVKQGGLTRD